MQHLTLYNLLLALRDLLGKRRADLELSPSGKAAFVKLLAARLKEIEALPRALTSGKPLADELVTVDQLHDAIARATYYYCQALIDNPLVPSELREAAAEVQTTFVPELAELKAPYADEAATAVERRRLLPGLEALLRRFPVVDGKTLFDWVSAQLAAADQLDSLLTERADRNVELEKKLRTGAPQIRNTTIGLLGRLRAAIADELAAGLPLPAELDARVFAYIDELVRLRGTSSARKSEADIEESGAEGTSPRSGSDQQDDNASQTGGGSGTETA